MKKTKMEWLDILTRWVKTAEALKRVDLYLYYDYYVSSSSSDYFSFNFSIADVAFKKEYDKDADEEAYNAVEAKLKELKDNAVNDLKKALDDELAKQSQILEALSFLGEE